MTGKRLGVGFVGSGFVARFHVQSWRGVRDADVLRVYSPNAEHAEATAALARELLRQLCGGISRSTVMRELRRKRLACYRARKRLRFSEEHITKYLERVEQEVK
jgi:ornithine cyclodeaminase/alanine dehydrogenase-like protein (mu-crystallin family)